MHLSVEINNRPYTFSIASTATSTPNAWSTIPPKVQNKKPASHPHSSRLRFSDSTTPRLSFNEIVQFKDESNNFTTGALAGFNNNDTRSNDEVQQEDEEEVSEIVSYVVTFPGEVKYVFDPNTPLNSTLFLGTDIPVPNATRGQVLGCFAYRGNNTLHFILPRVCGASHAPIYLQIPNTISFPLMDGDEFILGSTKLKISVPKLARSIPESKKDSYNPAQIIPNKIVFETGFNQTRRNRWNNVVECTVTSQPNRWSFGPQFMDPLTFGSEALIHEPDKTLSSMHAFVTRKDSFYSLSPIKNSRPVFLLLGKRDTHYRPSTALRLGDCFTIGKSEFCVVFQQRGNRIAFDPNKEASEELTARLLSMKSMQQEKPLRATSACVSACRNSNSSSRSMEVEEEEEEEEETDLFSHVKNVESGEEEVVPAFRTVDSILSHFEITSPCKDPLMLLMCLKGPRARNFFLCNAVETTFGSDSRNSITITNDKRMSPVHCRVLFDETQERWILEDLESKHGTFLKVLSNKPLLLCPGDVFCMGTTVVKVATE